MVEPLIQKSGSNDEGCHLDTPSTTTLPPPPRFPQEIVYAILDEVGDDMDVLRQCRLASHAMSISARPRVHRKIVITSAVQCKNFYRLCRDIEDIPGIVRELQLRGDESLHPEAGRAVIGARWTAKEPSLPAVLAILPHIRWLHLTFIMWNDISTLLISANLRFLSLRFVWFQSMIEVASFMKKASHLRDVELRDEIYFDIVAPVDSEDDGRGPTIESLSLSNHTPDFIVQTVMSSGGLNPLSFRSLKRLSIHLPDAFDCLVIEEMVCSSRGPLEELTLTAPRRGFGVASEVAHIWSWGWVGLIPTSRILPSRISLRVLRFQMVDHHDQRDSVATHPLDILIWLTRFLANEDGPICLEQIIIEVILTNPRSVESCLNDEVWRNWDEVLSRNNVSSLKSVHVRLCGSLTRIRMDYLRQEIISCLPQLNSKDVLRVDAPRIAVPGLDWSIHSTVRR